MKRLLCKLFMWASILVVLCTMYSYVFLKITPPQYRESYQGAMLDKVERLISINEPKIILIGNSNLAFGMNSQLLEEGTGMPVVNLGLHGGLGNKLQERMALLNINEGDIVIVCHSDYGDDGTIISPDLAWISLENHKLLWGIPDWKQWMELIPAMPDYIFNAVSLWLGGNGNKIVQLDYARSSFDEYGDNDCVRNMNTYEFKAGDIKISEISDECVKRLNELNNYCQENGARMAIAAYPIAKVPDMPAKEEYISFQNNLDREMDCDVISNFPDYFMEVKYFYDSALHLTNEGADARAALLLEDVKKWLEADDK